LARKGGDRLAGLASRDDLRNRSLIKFRENLAGNFRDMGPKGALLYYLAQLLARGTFGRASLIRYRFVAQPIADNPAVNAPAGKTEIRRVHAHDAIVKFFPRPPEIIAQRFAAGHVCLAVTVSGVFAGFLWLAFGTYEEDEVRCRYQLADPALTVWDFDVYVAPQFRLGRSFARLWDAANEDLRQRGVRWSISRISSFNPASLAAHARLGALPLGHASFLCLGRLQLAFLPDHWKPQLSWHKDKRPVLLLRVPVNGLSSGVNPAKPRCGE
jgi:hypothetical protein